MTTWPYLENLSLLLPALPDDQLRELLSRLALELAGRGKADASNYARKAWATMEPDAPRASAAVELTPAAN